MAEENELPTEHRRMFRFLHSSMGIISMIWAVVCLLIYFHAPSHQAQQLFDCRWYLASLLVQAAFGHAFVFHGRSCWLFIGSFISTQYAIVYSLLTLIIYLLDTVLLMIFPKTIDLHAIYVPYLKLTAVYIVLSGFGLALSLVHLHRLVILARMPTAINNGNNNSALISLTNLKTIRIITCLQAVFALVSIYIAALLAPMRFWYVRVHLVQEFSCSLLAISLALLQFIVFNKNTNGSCKLLIKGIIFANAAQIIQELNMALSVCYTFFYVGRIYDAVEERQQIFTAGQDAHFQLALSRVHNGQTILGINLLLHVGRMFLSCFIIYSLAAKAFSVALELRVKFKMDSELVQAEQHWTRIKEREKRWLYSVAGFVFAVAICNIFLNIGYVSTNMIFESLSVATGLSFVFSLSLLIAVGFYAYKLLRFCLIMSAYLSLNLLVTASLLLFAFIQDFFFLATNLNEEDEDDLSGYNFTSADENDTLSSSSSKIDESAGDDTNMKIFLYLADFGLSVGTFFIAAMTLRYAINTLLKTKILQTQPISVTRAIRSLHCIALVGIVSAAIEFFLLAEFRLESRDKQAVHNSVNTGFYDWLLSSSQFVLLFYMTRHERFQSLLPVQLLQLASVSITTLDLIGQQTESVQVYVNNVLQFYRVTEALFNRPAIDTGGGHGSQAIFITQTSALAIPLHLFVDILALHFLQIIQWFLTVAALVISLFAMDNMVFDESDQTNDFHELRDSGNTTILPPIVAQQTSEVAPHSNNNEQEPPQDPTKPRSMKLEKEDGNSTQKMLSPVGPVKKIEISKNVLPGTENTKAINFSQNTMAFDNQLFKSQKQFDLDEDELDEKCINQKKFHQQIVDKMEDKNSEMKSSSSTNNEFGNGQYKDINLKS